MARILIGVTGGIAAYKTVHAARLLIAAGHAVRVIRTATAQRFVGDQTFAGITGAPVLSDELEPDPMRGAYPGERPGERAPITHLALVQRADLYLIAPASANTIAKLAGGLADNLVTTAALAADCPVLVAPAMNDRMYEHPATQHNLAVLAERGIEVIGPDSGELASHGERGQGRMSEPEALAAACSRALLTARSWDGVRVLVTAGGTREPIDPVRYIGNRSSGRMGYALAGAAARRGAEVTVIAANVSLTAPPGVGVVAVQTAAELLDACDARFDAADVLLMAAAVADFRPREQAAVKLKKVGDPPTPPALELVPTTDVLNTLGARRRPGQLLVGFAAETGDGALAYGRDKLARKRLDAVVINDVAQPGIGFGAADNEVTVVTADGAEHRLARAAKETIADRILDLLEKLLSQRRREDSVVRAGPNRTTGV